MPTKNNNKFLYGWKIYVNYGSGWEYECFELTRKELKENVNAYRENCPYPVKVTRGRELNPDYAPTAKTV